MTGLGLAIAFLLLLCCSLLYVPYGRSRVVIGGYEAVRPRWPERFVFSRSSVLVVWIMQGTHPAGAQAQDRAGPHAPAAPAARPPSS